MSTLLDRPKTSTQLPQVFGRYLLVQRLSRGGMGEIFLARHGLSGFEKLVVIKKVLPHLAEDEQFISRFVDEAQVAIKLQHAHIAQVFEVGRVDDEYFLALEYVEGRDVRRTLGVLTERGQRLPVDLALLIARDVASGLSYAHRRTDETGNSLELVHCDISPPNIMVSFEGETKIIDFGIAKSVMRATATDPRMGFGKFGYMAPEQLIRGGSVDFRTDIYANGVILYELLTGQRMYDVSDTPDYRALARQVAKGQHPLPSHVDPALAPYDELMSVALRPDPDDRYQTAAEFRDAIQHALVAVNPTASPEYLGHFMRDLFAGELDEMRQVLARAEATDLEPWVIELTTKSAATISYAMANMPLVARADPAKRPPPLPTTPPPVPSRNGRRPSGKHAAAGRPFDTAQTQIVGRTASGRGRRRMIVGAVAAMLLVSGSVLAWVLSSTPGAGGKTAAAAPATGPADGSPAAPGAAGTIDRSQVLASSVDPPVVEMPPEVMAGEPERAADPAPQPKRPTAKRHARRHKRSTSKSAAKKAAPQLSRADVQRRFRNLADDYKSFRKSYGARLEKEWADLAHYATYAQSDDKLRVLDRRITHFRTRMRSIKD